MIGRAVSRIRAALARSAAPGPRAAAAGPAGTPADPDRSAGDCAVDWRSGDLAVCNNAKGWIKADGFPGPGPQRGELHKVILVRLVQHPFTGQMVQFLRFTAFGEQLFIAHHFSRIEPRADSLSAADPAFIAALRAGRADQDHDLGQQVAAALGLPATPPLSPSRVHAREDNPGEPL